jgi:hypothetical protein
MTGASWCFITITAKARKQKNRKVAYQNKKTGRRDRPAELVSRGRIGGKQQKYRGSTVTMESPARRRREGV